MNLFLISLLDTMVERNIEMFCRMDFVKSALYLSDLGEVSARLQTVADFYFRFLHQIAFLRAGIFKVDFVPDLKAIMKNTDHHLHKIFGDLENKNLNNYDIYPVHLRYSDQEAVHLVAGIMKIEERKVTFLHLVDLHIPKNLINTIPSNISYVREIFVHYEIDSKQSVRDLVKSMGYNYNQFQKDCKFFLEDTFYSFIQKKKSIEAAGDIIFTRMSFKEVAFKNRFVDYPNMYKTFSKYGVSLTDIPRLANL